MIDTIYDGRKILIVKDKPATRYHRLKYFNPIVIVVGGDKNVFLTYSQCFPEVYTVNSDDDLDWILKTSVDISNVYAESDSVGLTWAKSMDTTLNLYSDEFKTELLKDNPNLQILMNLSPNIDLTFIHKLLNKDIFNTSDSDSVSAIHRFFNSLIPTE